MQLEITLADGTKQLVTTDETWLTKPSAIHYNGIYHGELYDANDETPDWALASCSEQAWQPVRLVEGPIGELSAQMAPIDRITEIFKDAHFEASVDEVFSLDDVNMAMKKVAAGGSKGKTILKIS